MGTIKGLIARFKTFILNMKIREKIITIYIIGGFIPLLVLITYLINGTQNIIIEQTKASEKSELSVMSDRIIETMRIITDVSLRMYFDNELEHIAFNEYSSYDEMVSDYIAYDTISNYMNYYYKEINNIRMYLDNKTIPSNNRFYGINDSILSQDWYQETMNAGGSSVWNYVYDDINRRSYWCLTRLISTKAKKNVGVLMIQVRTQLLEDLFNKRQYETIFVMNDEQIVISNRKDTDKEQLLNLIKEYKRDGSNRVTYRGEDCVMSVMPLKYRKTKSRGLIVSFQPYRTLLKAANDRNLEGFVFIICSFVMSLTLIYFFSNQFSLRVKLFHKQMHKAANGNFNFPTKMEGKDEIGLLYDDLYTMIDSIQKLYAAIYEEKIQTEKINSRQKDVEFKMLASQINPHFLYNTLETIRMKARCNKEYEIEELVKMLAKIMRRNIEVGDKLVTLKSELELVEYYLKIQKYRFTDKIKFNIELFCDISKYKIMPLIIQPIVENAFVHGLEEKEATGEIYIYIEEQENLMIHVIDNGLGIPEYKLEQLREDMNNMDELHKSNIGLSNVHQRIKLLYGEHYGLTITSKEQVGTSVSILLPKGITDIQ
ncbi:hypothetical protein acsn021_34420 [Anaerocolumna cellulosilytica]|uniref:Uncharacterized protein n=1 Tax=Anaerocolumna cellulosilytica TaxID=433286 RepID=A0A6S6QXC3_9FIRM|nr:histidine kinase [Anaerocolumna cellulosilytica]MBB5195341.1 two-component system sensor histidine kinase YesM [Anaerocolumna cellulosilytica]BCJ95873.1 hypothetical protein acsn021_34420 [Anaerocolumna cellulosilytica]